LTGDERLDALAGAVAEYLARQYERPNGHSCWAFELSRYLGVWHTCSINSRECANTLPIQPSGICLRNIYQRAPAPPCAAAQAVMIIAIDGPAASGKGTLENGSPPITGFATRHRADLPRSHQGARRRRRPARRCGSGSCRCERPRSGRV
jgi:hypothetical protein